MGLSWLGLLFSASLLTALGLLTAAQTTPDAGSLTVARSEDAAQTLAPPHLQTLQTPREEAAAEKHDWFGSAPPVPQVPRTPQGMANGPNAISSPGVQEAPGGAGTAMVLLAPPMLMANSSNVTEHKGPVELQCSTQDAKVTIGWFFQSLPLKLEAHMVLSADSRKLIFITAQRTDSGIYQCEARSGGQSQRSKTLNITVNYGPDPFTIKLDMVKASGKVEEVLEGSRVTFSVDTQSYPAPYYTWLIPSDSSQSLNTSTITIPRMTKEHSGTYKCVVANQVTQLIHMDTLEVRVLERLIPPSIEAPGGFLVESENSPPVTLTCRTNHTSLSICWFLGDQPLQPDGRLVLSADNRTLSIHRLRRTDTGPYQCLVWHNTSEARSDPVQLTIYYGPDQVNISLITQTVPDPMNRSLIKAALGSYLALRCQADALPSPQYHWTSRNLFRTSANDQLIFQALSWEDEGVHECTASNPQTGRSSSDFVLLRVQGPSPGLSAGAIAGIVLGVLAVIAITIVLGWLFFRHRRSRKRKEQRPPRREEVASVSLSMSSVRNPQRQTPQPQRHPAGDSGARWQRPGKPEPPPPLLTEPSAYERTLPSENVADHAHVRRPGAVTSESDYEMKPPAELLRQPPNTIRPRNVGSDYEIWDTSPSMRGT